MTSTPATAPQRLLLLLTLRKGVQSLKGEKGKQYSSILVRLTVRIVGKHALNSYHTKQRCTAFVFTGSLAIA